LLVLQSRGALVRHHEGRVWGCRCKQTPITRRLQCVSTHVASYASEDYQRRLETHGITCSMSRRGNSYDNAVMEAFFSSLKSEVADRFDSCGAAKMELFDYIEVFYNQRRRHSTLDYLSPAEFERRAAMDAAVSVDAQNAPTETWKTAQTAVSHIVHSHQ